MVADQLRLTPEQLQSMLAHAQSEWPNEACGLLGGPPGLVRQVYPVENVRHSPVEYTMDPAEQVRVMLEIEAAGWEVCGIFHSHPAGPPVPSPSDVAQAYYPEAAYVILAPDRQGAWSARAFEIDGGRAREIGLEVGA